MSFGLQVSFGRFCGGIPRKKSSSENVLLFLTDLFSTLYAHDRRVEHFELSLELLARIEQYVDNNKFHKFWNVPVVPIDEYSVGRVFSKPLKDLDNKIVVVTLRFTEPYERLNFKLFHDHSEPICPICRYYLEHTNNRDPNLAERRHEFYLRNNL